MEIEYALIKSLPCLKLFNFENYSQEMDSDETSIRGDNLVSFDLSKVKSINVRLEKARFSLIHIYEVNRSDRWE